MTAVYSTPIGMLTAVFDKDTLLSLTIGDADAVEILPDHMAVTALRAALDRYFSGVKNAFDTIRTAPLGTPFQMRVWAALREIPFGEVRTYGEIAAQIGQPGASRAVGGACSKNHILLLIPCHRVVASGGKIGGFEYGEKIKRQLLLLESENKFSTSKENYLENK